MEDLGQKIEEYVDELFEDLGLSEISEDKKANIFAKVEEHLHKVILNRVIMDLNDEQKEQLATALQQQDYPVVADILDLSPERKNMLNSLIDVEMKKLTQVIEKEQKYERQD